MSDPNYLFIGFIATRVSPKRNVRLPLMWKSRLAGPWFTRLSEELDLPHIEVIPMEMLQEERIENDPGSALRHDKDDVSCLLSANCRQIRFGQRPGLTLPRAWCDKAGIAYPGTVITAGKGRSFGFWSEENFEKLLDRELSC